MASPNLNPTERDRQALDVSRAMGTSSLAATVFASGAGRSFRHVSVAEKVLAEQLGLPRHYGGSGQLQSVGRGIDMTQVQKPIRGAEELAQILVEEESEVSRVSTEPLLPYTVLDKVEHSEVIDRVMALRKSKHDAALKAYDHATNEIAEELEASVIEQCRILRDDDIVEIDTKLDATLSELTDPQVVRMMSHEAVRQVWGRADQIIAERKACIEQYAAFLQGVEKQRGNRTGDALREMADTVMAVGYILRDEAMRIVEQRAFVVNEVIVSNMRAFQDIIARLRRMHVERRVECRCLWAKREYEWRQLRHKRALKEFHETINSRRFTNPEDRREFFSSFRTAQRDRHAQRETVIFELADLVATGGSDTGGGSAPQPYILTQEVVKQAKVSVSAVNDQEEKGIAALGESLLTLRDTSKESADSVREDLRAELHTYSALSLPIPLDDLYQSFQQLLRHDPHQQEDIGEHLESTLRSGGALKSRLYAIKEGLKAGHRSLMYRANLEGVQEVTSLLASAAMLPEQLEVQGKMDMLEGLREMSEKMRSCSQSRLLKLLPRAVRTIYKLSHTQGLAENVVAELHEAALFLDPESGHLATPPENTTGAPSVAASSMRPGSAETTSSPTPGATKKKGGKSFVALIPHERLTKIREGQRRVASLLFVSNLPTAIVKKLSDIEVALKDQKSANELVDAVIGEECTSPLQQRLDEANLLMAQVRRVMRLQMDTILEGCQIFFKRFVAFAKLLENHKHKTAIVDCNVDHILNECHDASEDNVERIEGEIAATLDHVRHAEDTTALESGMERCLERLDALQKQYRAYARTAKKKTKTHSELVFAEACVMRKTMCELLGLVTPEVSDAALFSAPIWPPLNDEEKKDLQTLVGGSKNRASVDALEKAMANPELCEQARKACVVRLVEEERERRRLDDERRLQAHLDRNNRDLAEQKEKEKRKKKKSGKKKAGKKKKKKKKIEEEEQEKPAEGEEAADDEGEAVDLDGETGGDEASAAAVGEAGGEEAGGEKVQEGDNKEEDGEEEDDEEEEVEEDDEDEDKDEGEVASGSSAEVGDVLDPTLMHPAFVGFIPRRPRDLLPVAPLNESVPPVPQRSMNVLMIVHPSLEPVAKNVKEFNPAFFGYIPFPAPTPVKWQALAESNEFMPHGVPAVKPKPRHPKAHVPLQVFKRHYFEQTSADAIAQRFTVPPVEIEFLTPGELELEKKLSVGAEVSVVDASIRGVASETLADGESTEAVGEPTTTTTATTAEAANNAPALVNTASDTPLSLQLIQHYLAFDLDGQQCVELTSISWKRMASSIQNLRLALFKALAEEHLHRAKHTKNLTKRRMKILYKQLEERVRLHWPRKGRAEVQAMQPRVGELQNHRRRLARHERDMKIKMKTLRGQFADMVAETEKGIDFYHKQVDALSELLPTQSSLAALQGLLGQGKECTAVFNEDSAVFRTRLHGLCNDTHELFTNRNRAFSEASVLFEDGGDYASKEVATCEASIADTMFQFEQQMQEHRDAIRVLHTKQTDSLVKFDEYKVVYSEALTDLSMREGLGKKFGAPRRQAQESIRSSLSRSSASEAEINHILDVIEAIGQSNDTAHPSRNNKTPSNMARADGGASKGQEGDEGTTAHDASAAPRLRVEAIVQAFVDGAPKVNNEELSKAEQALFDDNPHAHVEMDRALLKCVICLRTKLHRRGVYLSALAPHALTADVPHDKVLPVSPHGDDLIQEMYEPGPTDNLRPKTFDMSLDTMEENCRAQTLALYEEVGKTDQLGEDQCPERLRVWLKKTRESAIAYEKEARKQYRHQVARFAAAMHHGPVENAFMAFVLRSKLTLSRKHAKLQRSFRKKIDAYDEVRAHHDASLRPELGSANHVAELKALTDAEETRCDEAVALVQASRLEMLQNCDEQSTSFVKELLHQGELFLTLLDGCILERDLSVIQDEVEIKTKRRSLKTLRRIRAVKEAGGGIDDGPVAFEGAQEIDPETGLLPRKGPRGTRKLWDGIPINQLSLLALGIDIGDSGGGEDAAGLLSDEQVAGMEMDELQSTIERYGKKPKGKKAGALRKQLLKMLSDMRADAAGLAERMAEAKEQARQESLAKLQELSAGFDSLRTHHHSAVIKGRAIAFGIMKERFAEVVEESDTGMDHIVEKEERLRAVWEAQVERVVKSCLK